MRQTLLLAMLMFFFLGCKKSELMQYHAGDNIYFNYTFGMETFAAYYEQITVPFGKNITATSYDAVFNVKALGDFQDRKRPFQLVVNKSSTAIAGVHFELPPVDSFYIAPSKVGQQLKVRILRPAALRDTVAYLDLDLISNSEFQTGLNIPPNAGQLYSTSLRIIIEDKLLKPAIWDASVSVLGSWSREKLEKMVVALPANIDLFYADFPYTTGQLTTLSKNMQRYLNTQKGLGNTVYEKDGSEMKMGPAAQ